MTRSSLVAALLVAVSSAPAVAQNTTGPVESLAWMSGCWEQSTPRRIVQESWSQPAGGTLMGVSRTIVRAQGRDTTVEWEFLRIFARDGRAVYEAHPSGQTRAEFVQVRGDDTLAVFENLQHDFPQRIIYRRRGADVLLARVEDSTSTRGANFAYRRRNCP